MCKPAQASTARFVSFEGIDGCGKSTLLEHLALWLGEAGIPFITTREPGGTSIGEEIRRLLLSTEFGVMDQRTEVLLYSASRAQLVRDVIRPALEQGRWVLADRFSDATLAYQGYGRGLDIDALRSLQDWATGGLKPHHTILIDCDVRIARQRITGRGNDPDRIEAEKSAFHQRVRDGYLALADSDPARFLVINGESSPEQVLERFRASFRNAVAAPQLARISPQPG